MYDQDQFRKSWPFPVGELEAKRRKENQVKEAKEDSPGGLKTVPPVYVEDTLPSGNVVKVLKPANHGKPWKVEEMDEVCRLYLRYINITSLAANFFRTRNSILAILSKHGGLPNAPENRRSSSLGDVFSKTSDFAKRFARPEKPVSGQTYEASATAVIIQARGEPFHIRPTNQGVPIMESGNINIVRNTLINGIHIGDLTEDGAINIIRKAQDAIAEMKEIENPPVFVQRRIENLTAQLAEFVELCDQKFAKKDGE